MDITYTPHQPGIRPYLCRLWPALHGKELRQALADQLRVHVSTVYDWEKRGMLSARFEHAALFIELCRERLQEYPIIPHLLEPSKDAHE